MAKDKEPPQLPTETAAAPVIPPVATQEETLTLDDFIQDLSTRDRRFELVNAFYIKQQAAGKTTDTVSNYQKAFAEFINKPVH